MQFKLKFYLHHCKKNIHEAKYYTPDPQISKSSWWSVHWILTRCHMSSTSDEPKHGVTRDEHADDVSSEEWKQRLRLPHRSHKALKRWRKSPSLQRNAARSVWSLLSTPSWSTDSHWLGHRSNSTPHPLTAHGHSCRPSWQRCRHQGHAKTIICQQEVFFLGTFEQRGTQCDTHFANDDSNDPFETPVCTYQT